VTRAGAEPPDAPSGAAVVRAIAAAGLLALGCEGATEPAPPPAPTLTAIAPTAGARATTVAVSLTGTDFALPLNILVSGMGVRIGAVDIANTTALTAEFVISAGAATGDREVRVNGSGGASQAKTFTVLLARPTLTGISPAVGARGSTVTATLAGTDFVPGATTVAVSGSGITVGNVSVASATTLTADFVIEAGAEIGSRQVTVTTVSGTSASRTFTVNPQPPTLASVAPAQGVRGTTVAVTLTGTNFLSGATTVAVSGSDVTVSDVSVASATSLTANFAIGSGAALGARDVTVSTVGGTSGAQTFTVNPVAPTLTAVSPTTGVQGTTVAVTLTGTNFVSGATTVAVSGSNVTVSNVSVSSATSLTADFVVGSSAALGDRNVTVTTAGGTTAAKTFTVNPPAPTLTAVSPTTGVQGTTVAVTLTGTNFVSGATTVAVSGSNVTVNNVSVSSGTSLTADFVIASSAALGDRNVTVTTSGGTTAAKTFTVNPPTPTLTSISPTSGVQGNTVSVTLTGTNFVSGATVAVSGSNVTVSNVTVVSATSITANFVIASTAAAGARTVTVTTSGGTSGAQTFTINSSADPQEVPVQPSRLPLTPR
jgi:IPT/TIG domain-containing protein